MSDNPFMRLWVGDFLSDTMHLSTQEVGAYLLLLMVMWRNGGTLPSDPKKLRRIARGAISDAVMSCFDVVDGDCITQKRLQSELEKARALSESQRKKGKAGGRPKSLKSNKVVKAGALPDESLHSHSHIETTIVVSPTASRAKQKKRLSEDWQPRDEDIKTLSSEGFSPSEIKSQLVRFRDYWAAQGKPMADWDAAFRNWVRKAAEMTPRKNGVAYSRSGTVLAGSFRKELPPEPPPTPRTAEQQAAIEDQIMKATRRVS